MCAADCKAALPRPPPAQPSTIKPGNSTANSNACSCSAARKPVCGKTSGKVFNSECLAKVSSPWIGSLPSGFLPACYLHPGGAAGWPQLHQPTVRQTPTPACLLQCAKDTSRWACGTKSATVCAKECLAAKAAATSSTACRCTAEKKPVCAVGGRVFDGPCAAKVSRHENVGGLLRNLSHLVLVLGPKVGGRTGHPELAA